jgi:hypothetical protein
MLKIAAVMRSCYRATFVPRKFVPRLGAPSHTSRSQLYDVLCMVHADHKLNGSLAI